MSVQLFTIGFGETPAERFFTLLREAGVRRVIDVRLNNTSQLAGYSKKEDLRYFLRAIGDIDYLHVPELAPTQEMLDQYKKRKGDWAEYERRFIELITARKIETVLSPELADRGCLLCSEKTAEHCHRRLVAEYLAARWTGVSTRHLT